MIFFRKPRFAGGKRNAFTLVELLAVLGIMSILLAVSQVGLSSLISSHSVGEDLTDLASLVEFSKTQAIARNTYVRVGFLNQVHGGTTQLVAGAVASKDGTTSLDPSNLYPISRILFFNNTQITDRSGLNQAITSMLPAVSPAPLALVSAEASNSFTMTSAGQTLNFVSFITITPRAEVTLNNPEANDPYIPIIEVGVQSIRGTSNQPNAPAGMLWIFGGSAQTHIFR